MLEKLMVYRRAYNELKFLLVEAYVILQSVHGTEDLCKRIDKALKELKL
jgi:hypothetical protein